MWPFFSQNLTSFGFYPLVDTNWKITFYDTSLNKPQTVSNHPNLIKDGSNESLGRIEIVNHNFEINVHDTKPTTEIEKQ